MSCKLTTRYTKPDNVRWFGETNANYLVLSRLVKTINEFRGVKSCVYGKVSNGVAESTIVFEDRAACDAYLAAIVENADYQARKTYLDANGITAEQTITDL